MKLFSKEKVNGWATAGTDWSLKLDRLTSREKDIASVNSLLAQQQSPYNLAYNTYRGFNMNLNAGFQVGYRFTNRLTLLMEPSASFFVVPLFNGYFNRSDQFSFGLKTGLRMNLNK